MSDKILGIDIGGTGIKGAIVDVTTGEMLTERKKILTPQPPTPEAVLETVNKLVDIYEWRGKDIGIGFPCVVKDKICLTANNISKSWIGTDVFEFFGTGIGSRVTVVNDADAAGVAESAFGNAKDKKGVVLVITIGTGIGSGFLYNGNLVPNVELGSIRWEEEKAEYTISNRVRKTDDLSWKVWGSRIGKYLNHLIEIYSPTEIILGGGVSKKFENFKGYLDIKRPVTISTAKFLNGAGVIGAAIYHHRYYT